MLTGTLSAGTATERYAVADCRLPQASEETRIEVPANDEISLSSSHDLEPQDRVEKLCVAQTADENCERNCNRDRTHAFRQEVEAISPLYGNQIPTEERPLN